MRFNKRGLSAIRVYCKKLNIMNIPERPDRVIFEHGNDVRANLIGKVVCKLMIERMKNLQLVIAYDVHRTDKYTFGLRVKGRGSHLTWFHAGYDVTYVNGHRFRYNNPTRVLY